MSRCSRCSRTAKTGYEYCRPCMNELGIDYSVDYKKKSKRKKRKEKEQCRGTTKKATRCRHMISKKEGGYCKQHKYQAPSNPQIISSNGSKPKAKTKHKSNNSLAIHYTPNSERFDWPKTSEGYLKSGYHETEHWRIVREYMLIKAKYRCCMCGNTDDILHVHHQDNISKEHFWEEREWELSVVCNKCHFAWHEWKNGHKNRTNVK